MKVDFSRGQWDNAPLTYAYSFRFQETPVFIQEDDCIANQKNDAFEQGFDNVTLMAEQVCAPGAAISASCAFEAYGAPLFVIAEKLHRCPDGALRYGDYMEVVPEGFSLVAHSDACPNVAICDETRGFYGVQYHPEVNHTEFGTAMIRNFLYEVCGAKGDWTMGDYKNTAIAAVREKVGSGRVLLALSGGVDSSVVAALLIKAVGSYRCGGGTSLGTYAARCIENEILMTLRASRKRKGEVSLSDPVGTDGEGNDITFMDILGTDQEELEEEVIRRVTLQRVRKLLEKLPPRERLVLELRYGLVDGRVYPQHEVARRLGISRSYVSRVEKHGLEMLRKALEKGEEE